MEDKGPLESFGDTNAVVALVLRALVDVDAWAGRLRRCMRKSNQEGAEGYFWDCHGGGICQGLRFMEEVVGHYWEVGDGRASFLYSGAGMVRGLDIATPLVPNAMSRC